MSWSDEADRARADAILLLEKALAQLKIEIGPNTDRDAGFGLATRYALAAAKMVGR